MRRFSGDALRWHRYAAGYSGPGLAEALGISVQSVYRYERGTNSPTVDMLCRIAEILGVDITDFFDGTGPDGTVAYPALTQKQRDALLVLLREA